ncbi:MAG: hypothetical protein ACP5MH_11755, partial [Thermoproteus sp.]
GEELLAQMRRAYDYVYGFIKEYSIRANSLYYLLMDKVCFDNMAEAMFAITPGAQRFSIFVSLHYLPTIDMLLDDPAGRAFVNYALLHELTHLGFNVNQLKQWMAGYKLLGARLQSDVAALTMTAVTEVLTNEKVFWLYDALYKMSPYQGAEYAAVLDPLMLDRYKAFMPLPGVYWGICHDVLGKISQKYSQQFINIPEYLKYNTEFCECFSDWMSWVGDKPRDYTDLVKRLTYAPFVKTLLKHLDSQVSTKLIHANDMPRKRLVVLLMTMCRMKREEAEAYADELIKKNAPIFKIIDILVRYNGKTGKSCEQKSRRIVPLICGGGGCTVPSECESPPPPPPPCGDQCRKAPGKTAGTGWYEVDEDFRIKRLEVDVEEVMGEVVRTPEGKETKPEWEER